MFFRYNFLVMFQVFLRCEVYINLRITAYSVRYIIVNFREIENLNKNKRVSC